MTEPALELYPVRAAEPGDAEACAAIRNDWIEATDWIRRRHTPEEIRRHYRQEVLPRRRVWVCGRPAEGFLALDPTSGLITALYCRTTGQGLGRMLLEQAKADCDPLEVWCFVANFRAQRFYRREGFAEVRRTAGENPERLPDILFRWTRETAPQ